MLVATTEDRPHRMARQTQAEVGRWYMGFLEATLQAGLKKKRSSHRLLVATKEDRTRLVGRAKCKTRWVAGTWVPGGRTGGRHKEEEEQVVDCCGGGGGAYGRRIQHDGRQGHRHAIERLASGVMACATRTDSTICIHRHLLLYIFICASYIGWVHALLHITKLME